MVRQYEGIFVIEISNMKLCTAVTHRIETGNATPLLRRNIRVSIYFEADINKEVKRNLGLGILSKSNNTWCSRIVPVPKKDGSLRLCIDYRPINAFAIKDSYPILLIDEIFDMFTGSTIFITLDATSGYFQITVDPADHHKTAFNRKGSLYEFNGMPFGLCNSLGTFQWAMDRILENERGLFVIPHLDGIIVFLRTKENHARHVEILLRKLKVAGISLNKAKCQFGKSEVKILGHVVSKDVIKPDPEKVIAIQEMRRPSNLKELRSFLGLFNYCRDFIPKTADITLPLYNLLKRKGKTVIKLSCGENKN